MTPPTASRIKAFFHFLVLFLFSEVPVLDKLPSGGKVSASPGQTLTVAPARVSSVRVLPDFQSRRSVFLASLSHSLARKKELWAI